MKKFILIIICFLLYASSFGQLKHFFPDTNSYFSVSWMKFWFEGDTVFDDLKYKKVYMQWGDSIANFDRAEYFAAIREDTIAEKVYCKIPYQGSPNPWDPWQGEEFLLYDFSVGINETVSFFTLWPWLWYPEMKSLVVESIDEILIDNQYRKRINFKSFPGIKESWIEGIGSSHGIFFPGEFDYADVGIFETLLLCVHIGEKLIIQLYRDCFEFGGFIININENKSENFKIYPTIADKVLNIETDINIDNFYYKIINMQGQVIYQEKLISKIIDISNLNKGFYLIVISDNKNIIKTQKFVKP
jgi:hypothetical protein